MNDLDRKLIETVCRNDLQSAKKIVKIILEQDKTQKNRMFVNRYLTMLNNSAMNLMELPADQLRTAERQVRTDSYKDAIEIVEKGGIE